MNEASEFHELEQIRDAITFDQARWQIDLVESGHVGLVRTRHVTDYIQAEATVELDDDPTQLRFLIRGVVIDCYDPVRLRTERRESLADAAEAATTMLRWVLHEADIVATRTIEIR